MNESRVCTLLKRHDDGFYHCIRLIGGGRRVGRLDPSDLPRCRTRTVGCHLRFRETARKLPH